jgi:hypothetical protein
MSTYPPGCNPAYSESRPSHVDSYVSPSSRMTDHLRSRSVGSVWSKKPSTYSTSWSSPKRAKLARTSSTGTAR